MIQVFVKLLSSESDIHEPSYHSKIGQKNFTNRMEPLNDNTKAHASSKKIPKQAGAFFPSNI